MAAVRFCTRNRLDSKISLPNTWPDGPQSTPTTPSTSSRQPAQRIRSVCHRQFRCRRHGEFRINANVQPMGRGRKVRLGLVQRKVAGCSLSVYLSHISLIPRGRDAHARAHTHTSHRHSVSTLCQLCATTRPLRARSGAIANVQWTWWRTSDGPSARLRARRDESWAKRNGEMPRRCARKSRRTVSAGEKPR